MLKRLFDITCSVFGILIVFPLLLPLLILVVIESKGGVLYKQKRVGMKGTDFDLVKIRTMYINADRSGVLTVGRKDNRVTSMGHFLRKFKLDEFPQLINVLIGDMSIVGPRPEVRKYVEMYTPEQMRVLDVRPGLTAPASLEYYNESEVLAGYDDPEKAYVEIVMQHKIKLSLEYINRRSFLYDIRIIFATFSRAFR